MSVAVTILGIAVSTLIKSKLSAKNNTNNFEKYQLLEQQKKEEKDRKRQTTWIAISISALLIVGAIVAYYTVKKVQHHK